VETDRKTNIICAGAGYDCKMRFLSSYFRAILHQNRC